jgi:hypothetical protein
MNSIRAADLCDIFTEDMRICAAHSSGCSAQAGLSAAKLRPSALMKMPVKSNKVLSNLTKGGSWSRMEAAADYCS